MTAPDLLVTLDAAAEDIAHARRAIGAAGRTEDEAVRRALVWEATMALVSAGANVQKAGPVTLALGARRPR